MNLNQLPRDYSIFVRPVGKTTWCATIYHQRIEWSTLKEGKTPTNAIQNVLKDFVPLASTKARIRANREDVG